MRKSFFCGNCYFLPAVQWTSAGGLCDGLYSTVVLPHSLKLDDFFPSYVSRSQDFLRVETRESFTWFISTRKESSRCPCQFLGCEYSGPSLGRLIVLVRKQPEEFRRLPRESDNCQRLAGKEKEPSYFRWSGDQIA